MSRILIVLLFALCMQLGAEIASAQNTAGETVVTILQVPVTNTGQELSFAQRAAALSSSMRVLATFMGIISAITFVWFLGLSLRDLRQYLSKIPFIVYEAILYLMSAGFLYSGSLVNGWVRETTIITGCVFLLASTVLTVIVRKWGNAQAKVSFVLFAIWAAIAVIYGSSWIGFFAVAALLSALGFSVVITPLCYFIGFDDDKTVGRTTAAAFLILATFIVVRLLQVSIPQLVVFDFGAMFLGSFVGYLGLLVLSSRWYRGRGYHYFVLQVVTILAGIAAIILGTFLRIEELQKIGGTFFILYLLEKPFELPATSFRAWMGVICVVSLICFALSILFGLYEESVSSFLFLPRG